MIKIFTDEKAAQQLCDDIHKYLQENCPGYSASKWQSPQPSDKGDQWYVQLPQEYDYEIGESKNMYPVKEQLTLSLKTATDKAVLTVQKLPETWTVAKAIAVDPLEEPIIDKP